MAKGNTRKIDSTHLGPLDIVVLALWSVGGGTKPQGTQHVAIKCFGLAPGQFGLTRYPKYPDAERAYKLLRENRSKGRRVFSGSNALGWLLTEDGIEQAKQNMHFLPATGRLSGMSVLKARDIDELNSLPRRKGFRIWAGDMDEIQVYEIADAVLLTADAPLATIQQKIARLSNNALLAGKSELKEYLAWLKDKCLKTK